MSDTILTGAAYPAAVVASPTFQQRATGEVVQADHMNAAQAEIIQVETELGVNPHVTAYPNSGSPGDETILGGYSVNTPVTATTVKDRLNKAEIGITKANRHPLDTVAHGATGAVVGTTNVQTLTNKTLASPAITGTVSGNVEFAGNITFSGSVSSPVGTVPIGAVLMHFGTSVPTGFAEFGVTISKTGCVCSGRASHDHIALWAELGLGVATTYALPSMADTYPRGGTPGAASGSNTTTIVTGNLPAHTHSMNHGHNIHVDDGGEHSHWGEYKSFGGMYPKYDGWNLLRAMMRDNYSTDGVDGYSDHSGHRPTVTWSDGIHGHSSHVDAFTGNTGSAGTGTAISVAPKAIGFRFLIRG